MFSGVGSRRFQRPVSKALRCCSDISLSSSTEAWPEATMTWMVMPSALGTMSTTRPGGNSPSSATR